MVVPGYGGQKQTFKVRIDIRFGSKADIESWCAQHLRIIAGNVNAIFTRPQNLLQRPRSLR